MLVSSIQPMDLARSLSRGDGSAAAAAAAASGDSFQQAMQRAALGGLSDLESMFTYASQATGVSKDLLKAVAKAESDFDQSCVSHCGATGIMQLMPETARAVGVTDVNDPAQNILGGARYLQQMLARYNGDTTLALAAYNAGPGAVDRYGGVPPYAETQNYVRKISAFLGGSLEIPAFSGSGGLSGNTRLPGNSLDTVLEEILEAVGGQDLLAGSTGLFCEGLKTAVQNQLMESLIRDEDEETYTF